MTALSDRALLTVARTGFLGFATLFFREVVYLGGVGALNGRLEGGRSFIGGHGTYREVPRWFYDLLAWYELAAFLWFVGGMIALAILSARLKRRGEPMPWL